MGFFWDADKNEKLKQDRGITFERIVIAIENGQLLGVIEHPNKEKFKKQKIMLVNIDGYVFCVPFIEENHDDLFLKTIFPSRKYTKLFGLKGGENEKKRRTGLD